MDMAQFECPRYWKPSVSSNFEVGRIPFSHLLAIWGNKNWPPIMKVKKLETFQNKCGLKGCIWSSLSAPGTRNPLSHPILNLGESLNISLVRWLVAEANGDSLRHTRSEIHRRAAPFRKLHGSFFPKLKTFYLFG